MPTFARRTLRQDLGLDYIRDTVVGTYFGVAQAINLGSLALADVNLANAGASGQGLYQNAWLRVGDQASMAEYQIGSFNTPTGQFIIYQNVFSAIPLSSATPFEVHQKVKSTEKDRAINDAILRMRIRQEVGIPSVDGAAVYTLDGSASPNTVLNILDCYYFANPSGSLNRDKRRLDWWKMETTATANELRISPALGASLQIAFVAILEITLGAADLATVNIPDERLVLSGAAAKCWQLLSRDAPSQEVAIYRQNQKECAAEFTRLASRFQPFFTQKIQFDTP